MSLLRWQHGEERRLHTVTRLVHSHHSNVFEVTIHDHPIHDVSIERVTEDEVDVYIDGCVVTFRRQYGQTVSVCADENRALVVLTFDQREELYRDCPS